MSRSGNRGIFVYENDTNVAAPTYRAWQHAEDAEAFAVGKRNGVDVSEADAAYHNNAKWYAEQAGSHDAAALDDARNAEAWARGTKDGTAVLSESEQYHNNAKWYAEQAAESASHAADPTGVIADVYDPTHSYSLGEYCLYGGRLYKCTTAITTAEAWNASHWTQLPVSTALRLLNQHNVAQTGSKTLTNNLVFPFNDSQVSVALSHALDNTNYDVVIKSATGAGNIGEIEITDRQVNGFKMAFTGSANSVTVTYAVIGGYDA